MAPDEEPLPPLDDGLLLAPLEDGVLALPEVEPDAEPLAPPEAEPDLEVSEDELGALLLLLDELGELGVVAELPPEGELDEDELPELDGGVDGVVALLLEPLVLPLVLPLPLSWPQAARPNARATATASVESFMCPPWLGY